jgi:thiopurine S-methyltransferase
VQPEFWHERWRTAQIGFHQSRAHGLLNSHWPNLGLPHDARVFVPLSGKSLDMLWLHSKGYSVAGSELSEVALEAFCMENGIPARRREAGGFDVYEAEKLKLFRGDFFALTPQLLGNIDAVYDRAALISWMPELRARYVDHLTALTVPGTKTLLISAEYDAAKMTGPPFSVGADEIERLYAKHHDIQQLERRDILASEPRFQSRGLTELHEVCYQLTRR